MADPNEEVKKAKEEEEEKRFQARVNERTAKENEAVRRQEALRWETENNALRAENKTLHDAINKRNEEIAAATLAEIETLKGEADPAIVELLPEALPPEKQLDWLKKAMGKIPAPPPTAFPRTPKPDGKKEKFQPVPPLWAGKAKL